MAKLNQPRMPMVDPSRFAMVPRSDVPRSTFATTHSLKTTFDFDYLVPIHLDEVLPGDVHRGRITIFARVNNLLFPLMDHAQLETFFFFVPCRLVWTNWTKFMGEQTNPADSISYTIPVCLSPSGGWAPNSLGDYFGLPTTGVLGASNTIYVNTLPLRSYNLIWNQWFRDESLQDSLSVPIGDAGDPNSTFVLQKRNKKHDYFTSCLPWPLKNAASVPWIAGSAVVRTNATNLLSGAQPGMQLLRNTGATSTPNMVTTVGTTGATFSEGTTTSTSAGASLYPANLYADLSTVTGSTINAMRLAAATQQFLEKDARGGTRYTELLRNHFGVRPEDARLQRPEYIGGGRSSIQTSAIPQTSATGVTGGTSPKGSLAGQGIINADHTFTYHATEHGYIIGLVSVVGDNTYQQGLHRMWSRSTRFDFYWPTFAHLGEQAVTLREIWVRGNIATDDLVFGYQERWAEYRYRPSRITGLFKSTTTGNIDEWHLAEQFATQPSLNSTFITQATPASRALAAGASAAGMQILFDSVFTINCTRPMPTYSVPGLTRF